MGGIGDLFKTFDGDVATKAYVGIKAQRQITMFLDGWGDERLQTCIQDTIWISDCIPVVKKLELKAKMASFRQYLDKFTDEEVYGWISQRHRNFIESLPGGKNYAMKQLAIIRSFLIS